ncbi:MAG: hypothetical protein RLZZ630_1092 [Bacteroidota bacterium]|jgi:membrane protein implicated in regulation of membrane protease activity
MHQFIKHLIGVYFFTTSILGAYFTAYIIFDVWYAPILFAIATCMLYFLYLNLDKFFDKKTE